MTESKDEKTWPFGPTINVIVGLCFNLSGSFFSSYGLILQKMSHNQGHAAKPVERWGGYWVLVDPTWWAGFAFMVLAGLMGGTGLYLCPMGLVAPFAGFTIVTNSLFAKWFLKESLVNVKVLGRGPIDVEVWGTGLVVAGTISCTTFGPHDEKQYSSEQLLKLFFSSEMMVHYIFTCVLLVSCIVVVRKPEYNKSFYEAFAYANMAGMIGGNQNLVLKTTMVLFRESAWESPSTYIMPLLTITAVILQLVTLNLGLARHAAVKYLPMYQSALVLYGVWTGGCFFQEFRRYTMLTWIFTPMGILLVMLGLWLFSFVPDEAPDPTTPMIIPQIPSPKSSPEDKDRQPLLLSPLALDEDANGSTLES